MSIENAVRNKVVLLERLGKTALNVKHPTEHELYVVALELIDADGKTLRYFIFPVNPSSLDEVSNRITNTKKTASGVVALGTTSFVPIDVNLSGNFGRKFKVLLGNDYKEFLSSFRTEEDKVTRQSLGKGGKQLFDERVKTGYGCLKILEEMVDEADLVDEKGPRRLIWYNLAFGSAYLVRPQSFRIHMAQDNNMVHNYQLQLKAIAPMAALAESEFLENERERLGTTSYIQTKTDQIVNGITKIFQ